MPSVLRWMLRADLTNLILGHSWFHWANWPLDLTFGKFADSALTIEVDVPLHNKVKATIDRFIIRNVVGNLPTINNARGVYAGIGENYSKPGPNLGWAIWVHLQLSVGKFLPMLSNPLKTLLAIFGDHDGQHFRSKMSKTNSNLNTEIPVVCSNHEHLSGYSENSEIAQLKLEGSKFQSN